MAPGSGDIARELRTNVAWARFRYAALLVELLQCALRTPHAGIMGTTKHQFGSRDIASVLTDLCKVHQGIKVPRVNQRSKEPFGAVTIAAFGAHAAGSLSTAGARRRR